MFKYKPRCPDFGGTWVVLKDFGSHNLSAAASPPYRVADHITVQSEGHMQALGGQLPPDYSMLSTSTASLPRFGSEDSFALWTTWCLWSGQDGRIVARGHMLRWRSLEGRPRFCGLTSSNCHLSPFTFGAWLTFGVKSPSLDHSTLQTASSPTPFVFRPPNKAKCPQDGSQEIVGYVRHNDQSRLSFHGALEDDLQDFGDGCGSG